MTRMGLAVTFVLIVCSVCTYGINYATEALGTPYLRLICYIAVIASAVQLVEMVMKKFSPALFRALGIYLPLITTNCAVLGVPLLNIGMRHDLFESMLFGFGSALGFTLALVMFAGIRERLEGADVPTHFRGTAIAMITAGIMSLAFMGFAGLDKYK